MSCVRTRGASPCPCPVRPCLRAPSPTREDGGRGGGEGGGVRVMTAIAAKGATHHCTPVHSMCSLRRMDMRVWLFLCLCPYVACAVVAAGAVPLFDPGSFLPSVQPENLVSSIYYIMCSLDSCKMQFSRTSRSRQNQSRQ